MIMFVPKNVHGRFYRQPIHRFHKMRPVGSPPELTIGDRLKAGFLLQLDHMANGFILHLAVFNGRYLPFVQLAKTGADGWRP
jgi:hypothetical protein